MRNLIALILLTFFLYSPSIVFAWDSRDRAIENWEDTKRRAFPTFESIEQDRQERQQSKRRYNATVYGSTPDDIREYDVDVDGRGNANVIDLQTGRMFDVQIDER